MRTSEFMMALNALCHDRELPKEVVIEAVEAALVTAYRRDFGGSSNNITVKLEPTTGQARVYAEKDVVDTVEDDRIQIALPEARRLRSDAKLGDTVPVEMTPKDFGRIAAQTAKQVILQRIREAERDKLYTDYAGREGEIVMGTVQSIDPKTGAVRLSLGKAEALLPRSEQLPNDKYKPSQRIRAYVFEVSRSNRGPQITVSRTHRMMLRRLLELEVPEISNGTVEIKAIAREAGARSKVAVAAVQPGIDPVGACVGMKGTRIQSIVNELNGEKIDIVPWSLDEATFVANALSPAKVIEVYTEEDNREGKTAMVVVPDKQLSLAIGKEGQNARLAAKLTGWRIDIKSATEAADEAVRRAERSARRRAEEDARKREEAARLAAARALLAEAEAVVDDEELAEEDLATMSPDEALLAEARALLQSGLRESRSDTPQPMPEALPEARLTPPTQTPQPISPEIAAAPTPEARPVQPAPAPVVEAPPAVATPPAPAAPVAAPTPPARAPQPQPPAAARPPAPAPTPPPVEAFEEEEEEDEDELSGKPPKKLIFYTLDDRGQPQDFGAQMEQRKKDKKKKAGGRVEPDRRSYQDVVDQRTQRAPKKPTRRGRSDKWGDD